MGYGGVLPRKTISGMAVASLVLGIVWVLGLGSVLAVIFGFISSRKIKQSQGYTSGTGLATAGIVLGFVGILVAIVFWFPIVFPPGIDAAHAGHDGYVYGEVQRSLYPGVAESSVCRGSNVPSEYDSFSSSWLSGCKAGWSVGTTNSNTNA
jgi:hypothetical protein